MSRILCVMVATAIMCTSVSLLLLASDPEPAPQQPPSHPTIEQIRQLAELVVLRISVNDIQTTTLSGYIGGIDLILIVHGEVQVACDLEKARFVSMDQRNKRVVLALPNPTITAPTLDHFRTKVYRISRTGMWRILPGPAGETQVVNMAMEHAQRILIDTVDLETLSVQAKTHTSTVLSEFFNSIGWHLEIAWRIAGNANESD